MARGRISKPSRQEEGAPRHDFSLGGFIHTLVSGWGPKKPLDGCQPGPVLFWRSAPVHVFPSISRKKKPFRVPSVFFCVCLSQCVCVLFFCNFCFVLTLPRTHTQFGHHTVHCKFNQFVFVTPIQPPDLL